MGLRKKTNVFFVLLTALLVVTLVAVSSYSFRHFSLKTAEDQARMAAEIVRVHLTESMVNGTIAKRETFMSRLKSVGKLTDVRVVRGPGVVAQFGPGLQRESARDEVDDKVVSTGKPYFGLKDTEDGPVFRATIPYVAQDHGDLQCTQCHQVKVGDVLGAVSLQIHIGDQRNKAILTIVLMASVVGFFIVVSMLFSRRLIRPLIDTASQVSEAVSSAREGDFSARLQQHTDDEVGQIAKDLNVLMILLNNGLNNIVEKVVRLIRYDHPLGTNQLATTIEMVDSLEDVSYFKQAIEEDETKEEVYKRLSLVMQEDFLVEFFSIYEVVEGKNKLQPMIVDGQMGADCRWCDLQILGRGDACRAKRTGHMVDGISFPGICTAFEPPKEHPHAVHMCFPMIQSGSVGSIVQVVTDPDQQVLACKMSPFIQVYLREAAPVLEAKRLMNTLRETALRDPMTGLHNRRFLQEYVDTLTTYTDRQKSQFSVLMADLDYFKQVNDTYGHESGDAVIKVLARLLKEEVRSSDLVIRYGGEEFLILLRDTGPEEGLALAEKIRAKVEETSIQVTNAVLKKTLSLGVAGYPDDSTTFWQVVKYADVALYRAKETGRNKVLRFTQDMWSEDESY